MEEKVLGIRPFGAAPPEATRSGGLLTMLIFLIMVTYMPQMSLWLPRLLGMM